MKSLKKLLISTLLVASTISLTSCKWIKDIMSVLKEDDDSSEVSKSEPESHEKAEQVVGKDGGVIKDDEDNIKISIPEGALSEDTNISAQYIEEPALISSQVQTGFLGAATFGPSGTTFAKPVEVSIQLIEEPNNSSLSVFCYNETEMLWEYVTEASVINISIAKFEVTHFSTYQVVDRTSDFYNEYQNIVRHAKVNGLSDTEIMEAFRDYLVNNKHIMDYYEKFDGYWYEPCGLKLSGKYQINGEQGDPNQLYHSEGESNKVGDTYGMCKIDGATSSQQDYKNRSSSSEAYDVCVIVEYKMIKPDIELTASKKKLKKGETATISIRCHYTNVANFFDKFKDLELSNYMLTIAKPTHFSTDKSVVLTNGSGRASFTVTALESNKAETITVNFDVSGPFGVHAEGNITLNSEGYTISGHIKQEKHMSYKIPVDETNGFDLVQLGSFDFVAEYDFEGTVKIDDEESSSITISNVNVSFSSIANILYKDSGSSDVEYTYDTFSTIKNVNPLSPSFDVLAVNDEGVVSLMVTGGESIIATLDGEGDVTVVSHAQGQTMTNTTPVSFVITLSNKNKLLLDFALAEGNDTYHSNSLVDNFDLTANFRGDIVKFEDWNFKILTSTEETTQTITAE